MLEKVRRRVRAGAAIQGAVAGAGVALSASAALILIVRVVLERTASATALGVLVTAGVVAGFLAGALRRIPLALCARAVDLASAGNHDRTLVALALMTQAGPFQKAALRDALRVAERVSPSAMAPWRRPSGAGPLVALVTLVITLQLWPMPQAPASTPKELSTLARRDAAAQTRLDAEQLALERAQADAARRAAEALADPQLGRLAAELAAVVRSLEGEGLDSEDALARLAALESEAAEAARRAQGRGDVPAEGLRAAGRALADDRQTEALGKALESLDGRSGQLATEALAARAAGASPSERARLSRSLDRAADAAKTTPGSPPPAPNESSGDERRLSRPTPGADERGAARRGRENDRRLKRLERDLSNSADRCREDPEACRDALAEMAEDLPGLTAEAQRSSAGRELARAAGQLRERLQRLEPGARGQADADRTTERAFERAAEGGSGPRQTEGEGAEPGPGAGTQSARAAFGRETSETAEGAASAAEGIGREPGGDPAGRRSPAGDRGEPREAAVASGSGPTRARVIEAAAERGFARPDYRQVFRDYDAAAEEVLDTTAVPAGRRYLVRRYFQLIRPR